MYYTISYFIIADCEIISWKAVLSPKRLFAVMRAMRKPRSSFKEHWVLGTGIRIYSIAMRSILHACVCICTYIYFICRYKVTAKIGQGHQVLGKVTRLSALTGTKLAKLRALFESVDDGKGIVYGRVLISGTLFSSAMYNRSDITNDSIISLSSSGCTLIGMVQKYVSCCRQGCTSCCEHTYCKHFAIIAMHPMFEFGVVDNITTASAPHIKWILKPK